jgi:hypothetical protein
MPSTRVIQFRKVWHVLLHIANDARHITWPLLLTCWCIEMAGA